MPLIQKKKPFRRLQSSYECCIVEKDFIDYSMFDVDGLEEVSHRFINSFSDIVEKCFNLENPHYTYKQIPQQWVL
jgi:hypothetical protein